MVFASVINKFSMNAFKLLPSDTAMNDSLFNVSSGSSISFFFLGNDSALLISLCF